MISRFLRSFLLDWNYFICLQMKVHTNFSSEVQCNFSLKSLVRASEIPEKLSDSKLSISKGYHFYILLLR